MADPHEPEGDDDGADGPSGDPTTGAPRWVKVFGAVAVAVLLLLVVLTLTGRGHGPGRHTTPGDPGGHVRPAGAHGEP